jgi:hypothetical protein
MVTGQWRFSGAPTTVRASIGISGRLPPEYALLFWADGNSDERRLQVWCDSTCALLKRKLKDAGKIRSPGTELKSSATIGKRQREYVPGKWENLNLGIWKVSVSFFSNILLRTGCQKRRFLINRVYADIVNEEFTGELQRVRWNGLLEKL